jgi:hypothetical protein
MPVVFYHDEEKVIYVDDNLEQLIIPFFSMKVVTYQRSTTMSIIPIQSSIEGEV